MKSCFERVCPPAQFLVAALVMVIATGEATSSCMADDVVSPQRQVMDLWPDGVPGATQTGEGDVPQLIVTHAESRDAVPAVVILPGGGYHGRAMDHEGYQIADWFRSMGFTSAICTYRVRGQGNDGKGYGHPYPMTDAQRAIQTVRANAKEWNVIPDKIGVIGFSAGGHLASTVSTHFADTNVQQGDQIAEISSRPDFSILCYPVIAMGVDFTHAGSQRNLLGTDPDPRLVALMSNDKQVTARTPPTFLFHTAADTVVPVKNSLVYYQACVDHGVPAEMHVFPEGRHGVGLAKEISGASAWPDLCRDWLQRTVKN
ncbi:alpha/beta hydrolase [Crateriforma conspicua]|uniref:alpha/beta hydrolase n=1 Tax=Crateriforma conspicua TaxID=2527996 RepID=UPI00118D5310|nr:alpha/beta hydrolase [Crateriforma conspicua]QDV65417.1 Acetylxylan esterase precursor [Crateriforma conspicua]